MQRYQDSIILATGQAVQSAAVQVLTYPAGAVATIYSDNSGTVATNPLITDGNGHFAFYAADGRYSLSITKVGIAPITTSDILLEDPADGSAALSASSGASLVGFLPSGTAPTYGWATRTSAAKISEIASLKDFKNANGSNVALDDSQDDTTGYQSALTWMTQAAGRALYHPNGFAKITDTLTIPVSVGWKIFGASRGGSGIKQYTANKGIFTLTACDTHSWNISDLTLTWNSAQASSQTSAIAIYLSGATGIPGNGYYAFQIERCTVTNGFRAIANDGTIQLAVWGFAIRDLITSAMSGSTVNLTQTPSVGCPRIVLDNLQISAGSCRESSVVLTSVNGGRFSNIEFLNGTLSSSALNGSLLALTSCAELNIDNVRAEGVVINSDTFSVMNLSDTRASLRAIQIAVTLTSAITGYGIKLTGSVSQITLDGFSCSAARSGGAAFVCLSGSNFNRLENYNNVSGGPIVIDPSSTNVVFDGDRYQLPTYAARGDVNVTLTMADAETQLFYVQKTANRTCTLPNSGLVSDKVFRIVHYAATPGAFTLTVADPLTSNNIVFPANTKAFATYKAVGTTQWFPVEYGTFP